MNESCIAVLNKLQRKRHVSVLDFSLGFRLAARVYDLRKVGYDIRTVKGDVASYVLVGQPHGKTESAYLS